MFIISYVGKIRIYKKISFFFISKKKIVCTNEQQLIRKLLQFYEPCVRPVLQAQAVVTVSFRMEITQLFELVRMKRD